MTYQVLLVEDNPADVELIRDSIGESAPVDLSVATNGDDAIVTLRGQAGRIDLVILDLNLPRSDGRQVLSVMNDDAGLATIPTVVFSSSDERADIDDAYRLGANCYLTKPADLRHYVATVRGIETFWLGLAELPGPTNVARGTRL